MSQDFNYSKELHERDLKYALTDYASYVGNLIYIETVKKTALALGNDLYCTSG